MKTFTKIVAAFESASNLVEYLAEKIITLQMFIMVGIVFIEVMSRFIMNYSLAWAWELARFLLIWVVFFGASLALKKGELVAITFVVTKVPSYMKTFLELLIQVLIFIFLVLVVWHGGSYVAFLIKTGQISPALQMPIWLLYLGYFIGVLFMFIHMLASLSRSLVRDEKEEG